MAGAGAGAGAGSRMREPGRNSKTENTQEDTKKEKSFWSRAALLSQTPPPLSDFLCRQKLED